MLMPQRSLFSGRGILSLLFVAVAFSACESRGGAQEVNTVPPAVQAEEQAPSTESTSNPRCSPELSEEQHRGVCYAHNWQHGGRRGYGSETSVTSLQELREIGINWVSITPFGWQRSLSSSEISTVTSAASENTDRLRATVAQAHELGVQVMMKPHIWVSHSEWRGHIDPGTPEGWQDWFASYQSFIVGYARLSQEIGADMFVVGVEFKSSTATHPEEWRQVIQAVREVYRGPVVYAANWDEVEHIAFWDALDFIGVQMCAPLSAEVRPDPAGLRESAQAYVGRYRAVSERFDRPVILTEVGYKSISGTAISPYIWPEHLVREATEPNEQAQADAYCAILETFGEADYVAGIYWWKWFTDPETDEEDETGFSPRGKLAEGLLRSSYGTFPR